MNSFKEKLKKYYQLDEDAFLKKTEAPSFSCLKDISSFDCVKAAISRLEKAKKENEKVIVYGDYDFDGISATSIIYSLLLRMSISASYYVPSRYLDGYGLNVDNVIRIAKAGFSLIFTVDNGVTSSEAIRKANELGIEVIVLDHHEYQEIPSPIVTLIHPNTVNLTNPSVSAGFLSYLFYRALAKDDDGYLLALGATSLLSDAMPLVSYNRDAVNLAVSLMNKNRFLPFSLLTERHHFFASTLQMEIIPKINAVGRVETGSETNRVVRYFVSNDIETQKKIALYLSNVNEKRKSLTKDAEEKFAFPIDKESIFLVTDLPEGLNGLLANRLLNEYEKPIAVFSSSKKDASIYVGSLRSKEGFDVLKALKGTHAPLLTSGGHEFAGGGSIKKEDLETFKKDFEFAAMKHHLEKKEKVAIDLDKSECNMENFYLLESFGPFGNDRSAPLFSLTLKKIDLAFTKNGKFLSTKINEQARLFSFSLRQENIPSEEKVSFYCHMDANEWKGKVSLQLIAQEMKTFHE